MVFKTKKYTTLFVTAFSMAASSVSPAVHADEKAGNTLLALADTSFQNLDDSSIPVVLTATRLIQAQSNVPASVTVIDRKTIEMMGVREIPELLRLVPGMSVGNVDGNVPSVSYHATVSRDIKRMQVMVDGRSVYQPGLARVLWDDIALTVDDIDRIEVTRGPNAAAYGPNSFSAIVNIITLHPEDTLWAKARYNKGNNGIGDYFARGGAQVDKLSFRVSAFGRSDDGYDENDLGEERRIGKELQGFSARSVYEVDSKNSAELHIGYKDGDLQVENLDAWSAFGTYDSPPDVSSHNYYGMFKWRTDVSDKHSLELKAYSQKNSQNGNWNTCMNSSVFASESNLLFTREAYELREYYREVLAQAANPKKDKKSYEYAGALAVVAEQATEAVAAAMGSNPDPDAMLAALQVQAEAYLEHPLSTEENALLIRARDIALANGGLIPLLCGEVDTKLQESRSDIELVDHLSFGEKVRLVSGLAFRFEEAESRYYLDGDGSNDSYRAFAHIEYQPFGFLVANAGGHYEHDDISGGESSPRLALNFLFGKQQSVRLVYSEATRSIDIYENGASPRIYLKNLNDPYASDVSGLLGQSAAIFYMREDQDTKMESEKIESREIGYYGYFASQFEFDLRIFEERLTDLFSYSLNLADFRPDNSSEVKLDGAEAQLKWNFTANDLFMLTFAHIDNEASTKTETRFTAEKSGSFMYNHRFDFGLNTNLAYFHADRYNALGTDGGYEFKRIDAGVSQDVSLGDATLKLSGKIMHRIDDYPFVQADNVYKNRDIYFVTAEVLF